MPGHSQFGMKQALVRAGELKQGLTWQHTNYIQKEIWKMCLNFLKSKQTWIWLLDKSNNHGRQIRLSDNKIYLEMSNTTWLVSDPVKVDDWTNIILTKDRPYLIPAAYVQCLLWEIWSIFLVIMTLLNHHLQLLEADALTLNP